MSRLLSKDFLSGVMFIAFGLVALYFGRNLANGHHGPHGARLRAAHARLHHDGRSAASSLWSALVTAGETAEAPKWKPITMVTIGIVCFALLFERAGLLPALVALVLIASLGGEEFKLTEVLGNMVVLAMLCVLVFKVGLGMNISIISGVW